MIFRSKRSTWLRIGALLAVSILPGVLNAHAVLEESTPAAGSTVGPKLEIKLRFNTRIDGKRSQLELVTPPGKSQPVTLESQDSPQIVSAHVALQDGSYRLRWQVLAVDGHITRGEFHSTSSDFVAKFLDIFEFLSVLLRALSYAAMALAAGGAIFLVVVIENPLGPAGTAVRHWTTRAAMFVASIALASVAITSMILQSTLNLPYWDLIGADYFIWGTFTIAVSIAMAWFLNKLPSRRLPLILATVGLLTATAMTSHAAARITGRAGLGLLTILHSASIAAWIGGLPFLLIATGTVGIGAATMLVRRFSKLAIFSVITLAVSGLALTFAYVDKPAALYGTAYGYMICTKVVLFAFVLAIGAFNKQIVARLTDKTPALLFRLRRLTETEIGIGFTVLLAAASLTSQPPAADLKVGRLTATEIAQRFQPEVPRLKSPPLNTLSFDPRANNSADNAWSEYNHHWAGIIVGLAGLLALLLRTGYAPWAVHWPLVFLGLAFFILIRSDPENWPLGPNSFWGSFLFAEVLQHRIFAALVGVLAIFEWRVRTGRDKRKIPALVFPLLCSVGGALLLTHNHALVNVKEELLAEMSHTPIAVAAVAGGWSRWLELRLPSQATVFGWIWPIALVSIGAILVLYREA